MDTPTESSVSLFNSNTPGCYWRSVFSLWGNGKISLAYVHDVISPFVLHHNYNCVDQVLETVPVDRADTLSWSCTVVPSELADRSGPLDKQEDMFQTYYRIYCNKKKYIYSSL